MNHNPKVLRVLLASALLCSLLAIASGAANARPVISDGAHGGNPAFSWRPPMVPGASSIVGQFNPNLSPTVVICARNAANTACVGSPDEHSNVGVTGGQYHLNWTVPISPTVYYRIWVMVGTELLGFADVITAAKEKDLKNVDANQFVAKADGSTLPIKFVIGAFATCATNHAACLYKPVQAYGFDVRTRTITDPGRVGGSRSVPIAIREPQGATGPLPIVIWSHGGESVENPLTSMNEWSEATAAGGYFSISIAHVSRNPTERLALCSSLGIATVDCPFFSYLNYDRPYDIKAVLDYLPILEQDPEFQGRMDLTRIVIGGHSAGSGGVNMIAGASREYVPGTPVFNSDPRPMAFLTFSPQGPGYEGFTLSSFDTVFRPVLLGTGPSDSTPQVPAQSRDDPFYLFPTGNKHMIYVNDLEAIHTVFEHKTDGCVEHTPLARCEQFIDWLEASALAFLDSSVKGAPNATAWLASNNIVVASDGTVQWQKR